MKAVVQQVYKIWKYKPDPKNEGKSLHSRLIRAEDRERYIRDFVKEIFQKELQVKGVGWNKKNT